MYLSGSSFQGLTQVCYRAVLPMGDPTTAEIFLTTCLTCRHTGDMHCFLFWSSLPRQKPMYLTSRQQLWEAAKISGWIPTIQGGLQQNRCPTDTQSDQNWLLQDNWKAAVLSPPPKLCSPACWLPQCFAQLLAMSSKPEQRVLEKATPKGQKWDHCLNPSLYPGLERTTGSGILKEM